MYRRSELKKLNDKVSNFLWNVDIDELTLINNHYCLPSLELACVKRYGFRITKSQVEPIYVWRCLETEILKSK